MQSVALNIGANSNTPGGRGPIFADGTFRYVPISEADETVTEPTYGDLGLTEFRPENVHGTVTHFDPEFPELGFTDNYTYGDRHPPKTTEIKKLSEGDLLFFYSTLDYSGKSAPSHEWINPDWGAYLIGHFTLEHDPISADEYQQLPHSVKEKFRTNPHVRRSEFDAEYLVLGNPDKSRLYDIAVPLSGDKGIEPNELVTEFSEDSGEGPWYRRPLRFDRDGTRAVLETQRQIHGETIDEPVVQDKTEFSPTALGGKGQLQFFFHAPESKLPVRDILGREKTEPYLEKQAENYCNECYQPNIRGFLKNDDRRYLFLFTKCENPNLEDCYDQRFIVGYIEKEHKLEFEDHWGVQGPTRLVRFEDAFPLEKVADSPRYVRMKKFSTKNSKRIVDHLDNQSNVFEKCLEEIENLKSLQDSSGVQTPSDIGC